MPAHDSIAGVIDKRGSRRGAADTTVGTLSLQLAAGRCLIKMLISDKLPVDNEGELS
jgi:hypothetical protein